MRDVKRCGSQWLLALIATAVSAGAAAAIEGELFVKVETRTFSEPTSVDSFIHDFDGDYEKGEYAFTKSQIEAGIRVGRATASVITRYDQFYDFSGETARLYYEIENDIDRVSGIPYELALKANFIRAQGVKFSYDWEVVEGLTIKPSVSYLVAREFFDSDTRGSAALEGGGDYSGRIFMEHWANEDMLLEFPMRKPEGEGYAFDLALFWQIDDHWRLELEWLDLASKIVWEDALKSQFDISTAISFFDTQGRLHVRPVLTGFQGLEDYTQRLPEKTRGLVSYAMDNRHRFFAEVYHTEYFTHTELGYEIPLAGSQRVALHWGVTTEAYGISYNSDYATIKLIADSTDEEEAHALDLTLGFQIPWTL